MVGYRTEDWILGGVAVFDRKESGAGEHPNAYWHSCRDRVTDRFYQYLDAQQQELTDFLLAEPQVPPPLSCPLPIIGGYDNRVRVSAPLAILVDKVYRDEWARKPATKEQLRHLDIRPYDDIDYPEVRDMIFSVNKELGIPFPA